MISSSTLQFDESSRNNDKHEQQGTSTYRWMDIYQGGYINRQHLAVVSRAFNLLATYPFDNETNKTGWKK